jgi:hypothetical protein
VVTFDFRRVTAPQKARTNQTLDFRLVFEALGASHWETGTVLTVATWGDYSQRPALSAPCHQAAASSTTGTAISTATAAPTSTPYTMRLVISTATVRAQSAEGLL